MAESVSPWMLDALAGVVLLGCACAKGAKGLYKSLMPLAVVALSLVSAAVFSAVLTKPVTELVYPLAEERVVSSLKLDRLPQEDLERFAALAADPGAMLARIDAALPKGMLTALTRLGVDAREFLDDALQQARDAADIRDYLSDEQLERLAEAGISLRTAASAAAGETRSALAAEGAFFSTIFSLTYRLTAIAVHYLLWGALCVLFLVLLTVIKNTLGLAFDLPVIGWVDRLGGAVLGAAEAGAAMFVVGWLARLAGLDALHALGRGTVLFRLFF